MLVRAYSKEEALRAVERRLKKDRAALRLTMVRPPNSWFGIPVLPGLYRISWNPRRRPEDEQGVGAPRDGLAGIQKGEVSVVDPIAGGKPAVIVPGEGVTVKVNGVEVWGPTPVRAGNSIELQVPSPRKREGGFALDVSPDDMSVTLKVFPEEVVTYHLLDQAPTYYLIARCERRVEKRNTVTFTEVMKALQEKRITCGIDEVAIQRAVLAADGEPTLVARGVRPQPGKNGRVRFVKPLTLTRIEHGEAAKVNYWEKCQLPTVQPGEVIACVEPAVVGKSGITVKGVVLPSEPVKEAAYVLRENEVILGPDGKSIVAQKYGRPVRRVTHGGIEIGIMDIYVHAGDVDLHTGNLTFTGDVLVLGNIEQRAKVEAGGKLVVKGNASNAFLLGNAGIDVDGCLISSQACAGRLSWFATEALALIRPLSSIWQQATERNSLDEGQLKLWQLYIFDLARTYQELDERYFDEIAVITAQSVTAITFFKRHRIFPQEDLRSIGHNLKKVEEKLLATRRDEADLALRWAWGSNLKAASSITVTDDKGCFDCRINAGREVTIKGTVRRSWIHARGDIRILGEVGSPFSEEEVVLETTAEGSIYVAKAYPGIQIRFGNRSLRLQEQVSSSLFYINETTHEIVRK